MGILTFVAVLLNVGFAGTPNYSKSLFTFNNGEKECVGIWTSHKGHALTTQDCLSDCSLGGPCPNLSISESYKLVFKGPIENEDGNYALMQIRTDSNACLPLSPYRALKNQKVYVISGTIRSGVLDEVWTGTDFVGRTKYFIGGYLNVFASRRYLTPFSHVMRGATQQNGWPVITTNGYLEGVALRLSDSFTKVLRSDHIFKSTLKALGEEYANDVFSCE